MFLSWRALRPWLCDSGLNTVLTECGTVIRYLEKTMKQFFLGIISLLLTSQKAQILTPMNPGSSVNFEIKNFGFTVGGSFTGIKGTVQFDPKELNNSSFDVTIDANSINTGIDMRDEHLRGESYFDVKNYPRIHFVSTKISS